MPSTPTLGVYRNEAGCTLTAIEVVMPEITGNATGGSPITSYLLEFNGGSGISFSPLIGADPTPNLNRIILESGLTTGTPYSFRYTVRNIFGWASGYSPIVSIKAAKVPDAPASVTTTITSTNVEIHWAIPATNGADISSYKIKVLTHDGLTYAEDTLDCDGATNAVLTT